jgi:protein TonB
MGMVAALHVCALFVIARSMGIGTKPADEGPMIVPRIDDPVPIVEPPPPIDDSRFIQREITVTPLEPPPPLTYEPDTITNLPPEEGPVTPPTGETFQGPVMVGVRPDARYPLSQPAYPPQVIREGKTGSADVEVYVLPSGRVGDARIVRSSGVESLDQSTLTEAKRNWRLMPATRDGVPIAQWHRLRVTFKLNRQ